MIDEDESARRRRLWSSIPSSDHVDTLIIPIQPDRGPRLRGTDLVFAALSVFAGAFTITIVFLMWRSHQ